MQCYTNLLKYCILNSRFKKVILSEVYPLKIWCIEDDVNINNLITYASTLPDDVIVYFLGHSEQADDGREHFKTIGKMLDNYVTLEGKFTIVLKTIVQDNRYMFSTQNSGQDTVKSPMGLFADRFIENDLKAVDDAIREYWGLNNG